jgi:hypothetical protein
MREAMARLAAEVAACASARVCAMSDDEAIGWLDDLTVVAAQITAMQAHTVRELDVRGVPAAHGVTGILRWLRERYRCSLRQARRLVDLGRLLDKRPGLDKALTAGAVNIEQVEAIGVAVAQLAGEPDVPVDVIDQAETALVGQAAVCPPKALHQLGGRILAHVAPDLADRVDAAILARQEARGRAVRTFQLTAMGDGRVRCTGWLDAEGAAIVEAALDPLCGFRRNRADIPCTNAPTDADADAPAGGVGECSPETCGAGPDLVVAVADDRTPGQRRADALVQVCRLALNTGELPATGGDRPQLVVTVNYDTVRQQLGAGQLDTGEQLSATQVRQLACDAQILPAVLGTAGQVLDYGRARRLITGPLRRALNLRDRGCVWPGCPLPARYAEGHHTTPWHQGGITSLATSALLCPPHHHMVHRQHWTVRIAADGHPELIPPEWLDPTRTPRRNIYHRRC